MDGHPGITDKCTDNHVGQYSNTEVDREISGYYIYWRGGIGLDGREDDGRRQDNIGFVGQLCAIYGCRSTVSGPANGIGPGILYEPAGESGQMQQDPVSRVPYRYQLSYLNLYRSAKDLLRITQKLWGWHTYIIFIFTYLLFYTEYYNYLVVQVKTLLRAGYFYCFDTNISSY